MKGPQEVYEEIIQAHQGLERIPEGPHLFCAKINDADDEDYIHPDVPGENTSVEEKKARIEQGRERLQLASWASLILGINKEQADRWLPDWINRTESFLMKCDACVRNWHMNKKALRNRLLKEFDEETTEIMESRLHDFDTTRIGRGLQKAVDILEEHGPMSSAKLLMRDETAVLAFYEALCCVPYLAVPENRKLFNIVFQKTQQKKPLKMGEAVIPTMTVFLFQEDPLRNRFARTAWERLPAESLTADQFEWAVSDHLADAIEAVNRPNTPYSQIQIFWEGFLVLLDAMSEDLILHSLRGMQNQTDIYSLAIQHLVCDDEQILALLLKAMCALMDKSSKAFWAALPFLPPAHLPMQVWQSPAFGRFASRSFEEKMMVDDGPRKTPILVAFVKALMTSLPIAQRNDVCEAVISKFLDNTELSHIASREGQATCILAGLTVLQLGLDGFLDSKYRLTHESFLFINTMINYTVKYKDAILNSVRLQRGDHYNIGLSQAALRVMESALALDTRAIREEWRALQQLAKFPETIERRSAQLWEAFLEALLPGKVDLARIMLMATLSLRGVQRFTAKRREDAVGESKKRFNREFEATTDAIARAIERVSEFNQEMLKSLCSDAITRTIDPIVASLIHGEEAIRDAGVLLLKAITGEERRSDAIAKMLEEFPDTFLMSFSETVEKVTSDRQSKASLSPWAPMPNVQRCSRDILNGLSDTSRGLLRSRTLTSAEKHAVKHWWSQSWQYVDYSFRTARHWSHTLVEKATMEEYCRDVMEFSESLLAQDGLIASALGGNNDASEPTSGAAVQIMKEVLDAPQTYCWGFIEMIQLKDLYLLGLIVSILVKLFSRLKEFDMSLPPKMAEQVRRACKQNPDMPGKFLMNTNMDDTQRAELLRALGDDVEDDEVEVIAIRPSTTTSSEHGKEKPKKQSTIDAWSRSSSSPSTTASGSAVRASALAHSDRASKDLFGDLIPNSIKHRGAIEKMKKAPPKPDQRALLANRAAIRESRARDKAEMQKHKAKAAAEAQALRAATQINIGEGSGLKGIAGIADREPAQKKSEIMVDSESEEEDSGDEEDVALLQRSKKGETMLGEAERRQKLAMLQAARGPVKKVKLQRSAKDMRARIIPPMEKLHQAILEWDIFHEGNDPPNGYKCEAVANAYVSPKKYKDTFFPLLIYEAWRSFVTAKDETTSKPVGIRVVTRMSVDNFLEVGTMMPAAANKDRSLAEGDIVLFSKAEEPLANRSEPHCLARIWKTTYKKDNLEVTYRLSSRGNQVLPVLLPGSEFRVVKITNMTTIEREYAALESLQYYDLMDEVLNASPSPMLSFGDQAISSVQQNYELNRGQAVAILNAKENDGFTLIQGPPGTGKTKTIVAMVGALLTGTLKNTPASAVAIHRAGAGGGHNNSDQSVPKKLLVCAPSNAAVDELVLRLKSGIKEMNGTSRRIKVLRLGRSDAINAAVRDVTLDELVKAEIDKMTAQNGGKGAATDREKMHQRAGEIKTMLQQLIPSVEAARADDNRDLANKIQRDIDELRREQRQIGAKIDQDKDSGNTYAREAEIKRRLVQQRILNEAHVLCATLSGSGHEMFKNLNVEFETVIIDEAAQCVELSALIPLKYGCSKCILVGDPKQLPPTVLSQSAARYGYDQSLFVRMQRNHPQDIHLLDTQYRMHPEISLFPSQEFYEGKLIDGGDMAQLRKKPWHDSSLLGPYRFFDVEGFQERGHKGQSLVNVNELQVALQLYKRFRTDYRNEDLKGKIGIITPYKAQLFALRQRFTDQYGEGITNEIEFNTTDAFQGRECEIIIFSCVRASPTGGIGFMTDIRRMNVGLTRAKSSLWILGDSRALRQGQFWRELIENAKARDRYTSGNIINLLKAPSTKATPGPSGTPSVPSAPSATRPPSVPPTPAAPTAPAVPSSWQGGFSASGAPISPSPSLSASAPVSRQGSATGSDVEMEDSSKSAPPPSRKSRPPPKLPTTYTVVDRGGPNDAAQSRIGGLNERGEILPPVARGPVRPVVHTSPTVPAKRPSEAGDQGAPPAKRASNAANAAISPPAGPRAMMSRPPRMPTDPTAMDLLGMQEPPQQQRPQQQQPPHNKGEAGKAPGAGPKPAPKGLISRPPKKKPASLFIERKKKP